MNTEYSNSTENIELPPSRVEIRAISGEEMEINMGPHHPSTHGVIRFVLKLDGEMVTGAYADVGYLHRAIEKIAENLPYAAFMPYTDRVDYIAALNCNVGYAEAVEKLAAIEIPERAIWLRMLGSELNRIASHLLGVGALTMDIGAFTPFVHALREREYLFDLLEMMTGARMTYNYARIGGVSRDVSDEFLRQVEKYMDHFVPFLDEFHRLIGANKIYIERLIKVGAVNPQEAASFGFSGPNLRASGVDFDLRKKDPYLYYNQMDFSVPLGGKGPGVLGDSYDRYIVRIHEMEQSEKIIRQILSQIKEGEVKAKVPKKFVPPKGEIYSRTEAPRGELGFYIASDGVSTSPQRLKIRTGSFTAMTSLAEKLPGMMVADVIAYFASLDVVAPEVDR